MNEKEINLLCHFLDITAEQLGNNGCNDVEEEVWNNWSLEERKEFVKEYHNWNGDPEEYNEKWLHIPDYAIISFLKYKLNNYKRNMINNKKTVYPDGENGSQ